MDFKSLNNAKLEKEYKDSKNDLDSREIHKLNHEILQLQ